MSDTSRAFLLRADTSIPYRSQANPLLDPHIWTLLHDILEASTKTTNASRTSRPLRTWLLPLLNRLPIAPILVAFFGVADHASSAALLDVASQTLTVLWPMAVPKTSIDLLLESYSSVAGFLAEPARYPHSDPARKAVLRLVGLVVSSYRSALANSVAKKKV